MVQTLTEPWDADGKERQRRSEIGQPLLHSALIRRKMDSSPTSLFDSYEHDFQQIISSIKGKLEGAGKDGMSEYFNGKRTSG